MEPGTATEGRGTAGEAGKGCHWASQEGLERVQLSLGAHTTTIAAHGQWLGEGPTRSSGEWWETRARGFIGEGPGQPQAGLPGATSGLRASPAGSQDTAPASCLLPEGRGAGQDARAAGPLSGKA